MAFSLYDVSVPTYLQILPAVSGFLDKGLAFFQEKGIDPETVVETRLFPDMRPFRYQILALTHHSFGAMEGLKRGLFMPPASGQDHPAQTYTQLQAFVGETRQRIEQMTPAEINGCAGKDVVFQVGDVRRGVFTAEDFLLSFSLPNFYFHVTTAYDILRAQGAAIGKRDFLGATRIRS